MNKNDNIRKKKKKLFGCYLICQKIKVIIFFSENVHINFARKKNISFEWHSGVSF